MKKTELKNFAKNKGLKQELVDLIILKNLGITKKELFFLEEIDNSFLEQIKNDLQKLEKGEPIEYILGKANFFSIDFFVDSRVLIPRNDTEVMVEEVLKIKNLEKYFLVDVGTGSGAIICSILKNSEIKKGFAIDISKDALEVAKKNILKHNLKEKVEILEGDLLSSFIKKVGNADLHSLQNFIITANLPYVKNGDFENMSTETVHFEPNLALFGGENTGFELYKKLVYNCLQLQKNFKISEIILFIEIGFDQKNIAENFLKNLNLKFEIFKDNSGIYRCVKILF